MLLRPSMIADLEEAGCLDGASLVCSVWPCYLNAPAIQWLRDWLQQRGLSIHHGHTSGDATAADLQQVRNAFLYAVVVPVHLPTSNGFPRCSNPSPCG